MPHLHCARCGLQIKIQGALLQIENCPRCLAGGATVTPLVPGADGLALVADWGSQPSDRASDRRERAVAPNSQRPRWVIAELDVDGEIDDHAAMCLRHAIDGARAAGAATILVDLRDLSAIDAGALALFVGHDADCRASGVRLGLLICGHAGHDAIAQAFVMAGLGDRLQFTCEPRASPPPARRVPARPAIGVPAHASACKPSAA